LSARVDGNGEGRAGVRARWAEIGEGQMQRLGSRVGGWTIDG
jgi:hypothetical protein